MHDLVIPKDNEAELIKRAKQLAIPSLIFLKSFKTVAEIKQYAELVNPHKIGLLVEVKNQKDLEGLKKLAQYVDLVVASSNSSEDANRAIFESKRVNLVINISSSSGTDHTHYRRSGVNQVLVKLAKENNIAYAVDFSHVLNSRNRPVLLGREMQNIRVFKKYKVPVEIYSLASLPDDMRNLNDLGAFLRVLG